jgi:hypothetical protein
VDQERKPAGYAVFGGELEHWETDDLLQARDDVQSLTSHPGWKWLNRLLGERKQRDMTRLIHGGVLEQAQYAALTGTLSGMESGALAADSVVFAADRRERAERQAAEAAEGEQHG